MNFLSSIFTTMVQGQDLGYLERQKKKSINYHHGELGMDAAYVHRLTSQMLISLGSCWEGVVKVIKLDRGVIRDV